MVTIDELLADARARLDRVDANDFESEVADGAIVVDIRPTEQRQRDGEFDGALVIDRNVLEWRLAPSSRWRTVTPETGQKVIIVCTDGYSSSLAAAALRELGVDGATDLVGGYRALMGIPVEGG